MCIEAAVCFALGLPHGDNSPCVGKAVRRFKIRLNDASWPTNADRTTGMRKLAIAQLGSDEIDQQKFAEIVALRTTQVIVPMPLRYFLKVSKKATAAQREEIETAAQSCESAKNLAGGKTAALAAKKVMRAAADAAAYRYVLLCKRGRCKAFYVHRLLAQAYIPNPHKYGDVNHKNGERQSVGKPRMVYAKSKHSTRDSDGTDETVRCEIVIGRRNENSLPVRR